MHTRRQVLGSIVGLAIASFVASGCGKKIPLDPAQKEYAGKWVAADGTFVEIFLDGGGNFKTSNSNVTGGSAKVDGTTLAIKLGPVGKTFAIDQAPKEENGKWVMKLDGVSYTKQ